jgi:hypothetical protein
MAEVGRRNLGSFAILHAMQPVADGYEVEFRYAILTDVADVVVLVESDYRGDASRAGWTTEADLLDKRSR